MEWRRKLKNPFIQQYLIEIVFPLVGYFFFDWDILIIGVYYLIDHLCSQLLFFRRVLWIKNKAVKQMGIHFLIGSIFLFALFFSVEIIGLGYFLIESQDATFVTVVDSFLTFAKEELWILFPVVLFVYHFKDQFTFYMPRHYLKYSYKKTILWDAMGGLITLVLFIVGGFLWVQFSIPDLGVIFMFLVLKIGFDLTVKRIIQKKALLQ